jgi:ApaG protein
MKPYQLTTHDITISVKPHYLEAQSEPHEKVYAWSYEVEVHNGLDEAVTLIHRNWIITDISGYVEKIDGPGVVGEQPTIQPGETFVYSSFCVLSTPDGSMKGHYDMQTVSGKKLQVVIPEFILSCPGHDPAYGTAVLH